MIIENITLAEIKKFYPVTDSLSQQKINDLANFVKFNTFVQMFGLSISTKIFEGTIEDSDSENFIGFRAFVALCIAGQLIEETYIHTNAGLKMIGGTNWNSPKVSEKNNTLVKLGNTIENQFVEAKKILQADGFISANTYAGYSSFRIDKI